MPPTFGRRLEVNGARGGAYLYGYGYNFLLGTAAVSFSGKSVAVAVTEIRWMLFFSYSALVSRVQTMYVLHDS